jgi:hypothetical protein
MFYFDKILVNVAACNYWLGVVYVCMCVCVCVCVCVWCAGQE